MHHSHSPQMEPHKSSDIMFSFTDSDSSDSDDFLAVRQEQPLLPAACHQYTLVDTVTSNAQVKKLVGNHKFAYQSRGKDHTKVNTYACKLHANCKHRMQVVHSTDGIRVLERGRHSKELSSSKVGIHPVIRDQVDTIIRGTHFPI